MGNMRGFDWQLEPGGSKLPVLPPRRAEKFGAIEEAARKCEQAEMEEHWRLLYVALTRAEERLVICGSFLPKFRCIPPEQIFFANLPLSIALLCFSPDANPPFFCPPFFP